MSAQLHRREREEGDTGLWLHGSKSGKCRKTGNWVKALAYLCPWKNLSTSQETKVFLEFHERICSNGCPRGSTIFETREALVFVGSPITNVQHHL